MEERRAKVWGRIHSIDSAAAVDGPGIRRTIFFQGCPLACLYCHNPDARAFGCGRKVSSESLLHEIKSDRDFLIGAGGGVTLSGGEPLAQPQFAEAILLGCREMGVHTAIDTSGFMGEATADHIIDLADLFLLDIKHAHPGKYKALTGRDLDPTLRLAKRLTRKKKAIWVRYVLVPGYTDGSEDLEALCRILENMPTIEVVEVLPFHKMGEWKAKELGWRVPLEDVPEPKREHVARAVSILGKAGHSVRSLGEGL